MNKIDKQYTDLLQDILNNGIEKEDRTGTGTLSVFGRQVRHKMSEGFPLLTTKKIAWNSVVTELLWFLRGDTNIKFLLDYDCHIWDGDAYKNYVSKVEEYTSTLNVPNDISEFQEIMDLVGNQIKSSVLSKEEFIKQIKTVDEFAKKWGVMVEIRELSLDERFELFKNQNNGSHPEDIEMMDDYNIPTKLITITYNNETIEIYE